MNEQGQGFPNEKVQIRACDDLGNTSYFDYANTLKTDSSGKAELTLKEIKKN